jgi:two-component system sensor histidine kinase UhpB
VPAPNAILSMPNPSSHSSRSSIFPKEELVAALTYLILGSAWIVGSDLLLEKLDPEHKLTLFLQTGKGLNFIFTTAAIFYLILRRTHERRRRAEAESREANERFEMVARASSDAIFDWDLVTDGVWWSEGMENLFGYGQERARMALWSECVHPDDLPRVRATRDRLVQGTGLSAMDEFRFRRADGTFADVVIRGHVQRDSSGRAVKMVGGMSDVTARRQAERKLDQSHRQLRALSARLESMREEERTRIAREIHDELGQLLTGLKMDLRWIENRLSAQDVPSSLNRILDKVVEVTELVDATIASVQKIAADLRPGALDTLGLAAAIQHEAVRFQSRTGIATRVHVPEPPPLVPAPAATAVFRILQEALTNVARHAGGTEVTIDLRQEGERLQLQVCDNGRGLRPPELEDPKSLGLLGMRERATLLGGEMDFACGPGGGTVVTLRLPRAAPEHSLAT